MADITQEQKDAINNTIKQMVYNGASDEEITAYKDKALSEVKSSPAQDQNDAPVQEDTESASVPGSSDSTQGYTKDPSEDEKPVGDPGDISAWENFSSNVSNTFENMMGFDDRVALAAVDTFENLLGEDGAAVLYDLLPTYDDETGEYLRTPDEVRAKAYENLAKSRKAQEANHTKGIVESFKEGDIPNLIAASAGAATNVVGTLVTSGLTAGAGIYTDMVADAIYDANNAKAEAEGKTVQDLYDEDGAEFVAPAFAGVVGGLLERIGIKGVGKSINSISKKGLKKALVYANAGGKEGLTEWLQSGVEGYNEKRAGKTKDAATQAFQGMFTEQGLEAFLQGVAGGAGATKGGRSVRKLASRLSSKEQKESQDAKAIEINDLITAASKTQNPAVEKTLNKKAKEKRAELAKEIKEREKKARLLEEEDMDAVDVASAEVERLVAENMDIESDANIDQKTKESIVASNNAQIDVYQGEVDAIRKKLEGIDPNAKKEEEGREPDPVEVRTQEILEEEVSDNEQGVEGIADIAAESNIFQVEDDSTATEETIDSRSPLTKSKGGFTNSDFTKRFEGNVPSVIDAQQAKYAIQKEAKKKGLEAIIDINPNNDEEGSLNFKAELYKPREGSLNEQVNSEVEAQQEQEQAKLEKKEQKQKEAEVNPEGHVAGEKVAVKEEGPVKERTARSEAEQSAAPSEFVTAERYKGSEQISDDTFKLGHANQIHKLRNDVAGRNYEVQENEDGTVTLTKGKPSFSLEEKTTSEVDRIKSLPLESEDGATFNQDGTKYDGGGLVLPVASENLKASELTPERIEAFKKKHSAYLGAASKIGIYKFPGKDQVSIDLNTIVPSDQRERALEIGKKLGQESLFDLDTFENVKTGETGANPRTIGPSAAKRIADEFKGPDFNLEEGSFKADLRDDIQAKADLRSIEGRAKRQSKQATPEQLAEVEANKGKGAIQEPGRSLGDEKLEAAFDRYLKNTDPKRTLKQDLGKQPKVDDAFLDSYNEGTIDDESLIKSLANYVVGQATTDKELQGFALEKFVEEVKAGKFKDKDTRQVFSKAKSIANRAKTLQREAYGENRDYQRSRNVARRAGDAFFAEHGYEPSYSEISEYVADNKDKYKIDLTPAQVEDAFVDEVNIELPGVQGEARDRAQTRIAKEAGLDTVTDEVLTPSDQGDVDSIVETLLAQRPEIESAPELQNLNLRRGASFGKKVQGDVAATKVKKVNTKIDQDVKNVIGKFVQGKHVVKAFPKFGKEFGFNQDSYQDLTKAEKQNFRRKLVDGLAFEAEQRTASLGKTTPSPKLNLEKTRGSKTPADIAATPEWTQAVSKALSRAFPSVDVISTQEGFNNLTNELQRAGHTLPADIKGLQYANKVAINPSRATRDTPIHEFSHIWASQLQRTNPKLWKRGVELLKGSEYMRVIADNPHYRAYLKDNPSKFYEEVMANALGKRGAEIFAENNKKAGAWDNFLNKVGGWLKAKLDISSKKDYSDLTLDDWLNVGASSVLTGDQTATTPSESIQFSLENPKKRNVIKEAWERDIAKNQVSKQPKDNWFTRASDWFVGPSADDYHGLAERFARKFPKDSRVEQFKNLTKKYVDGYTQYEKASTEVRENFRNVGKELAEKVGIKTKNLDNYLDQESNIEFNGKKVTNNQAIGLYQNNLIKDIPAELKEFSDNIGFKVLPGQPVQASLLDHINKTLLKEQLSDFLKDKKDYFSEKDLDNIESKMGKPYRNALDNSLSRMSGNTGRGPDSETRGWNDWLQGSVGTIMFLNFRSAALQGLSTWNYMSPNNLVGFNKDLALTFKPGSAQRQRFKEMWNDPMLKERRARAGFDVNAEEILDDIGRGNFNKTVGKILNKGFVLTSLMDSFAIAAGGAAYVNQAQREGQTKEEALQAWRDKTQEAQQSARPDRVSKQQKSAVSKLILAFANTPQQYFRLSQKSYRTIRDKGLFSKEGLKSAREIAYYMAIQNAIFTMAQSASTALFTGWGGDDDERKEAENALNSMTDTWLRGMGLVGAIAAAAKNTAINALRESDKARPDYGKGLLKGAVSVAPPLSRKINDIIAIGNAYKYDEGKTGARSAHAVAAGRAGSVALNVPSDWLQKKLSAAQAYAVDGDADLLEFIQMFGGYSEYSVLGGKKDNKGPFGGGKSPFNKKNSPF